MGNHRLVTDFLKFLQIIPFVAKFPILKAITTVLVRLPCARIFAEGHETALTRCAWFSHREWRNYAVLYLLKAQYAQAQRTMNTTMNELCGKGMVIIVACAARRIM